MPLPLARFRVLDLTEGMAGPSCAQHLADFGADVVKIQSPLVAAHERFLAGPYGFGRNNAFGAVEVGVQRNKRRMLLNLKSDEGREIIYRLIATADVILESNRPGAADRLGIGYEAVSAVRPEIVYGSLSGFGQTGPERERRGTDQVLQAYAGPMSVTGEPGRNSVRMGPSVVDLLAGAHLAFGILAALLEREVSGRGQWVDTSLYDATIAMMSRDIAQYTGDGKIPEKFGAYFPFTAPYGNFFAKDGEFFIGIHDTEGFTKFCELAGLDDIANDERFANSQDRLINRDALYEQLVPAFAARTVEEWLAFADAVGALSSRVNDVSDLIEQEQAKARELIVDIGIDNLKVAGIPIKLSRTPGQIRMAPHVPGEDTDAILGEIGYSTEDVARLHEAGVVA